MMGYGYAPDAKECRKVPAPPTLQTKLTQQYLGFKPAMVEGLGRRLSNVTVARQLAMTLKPQMNGPVSVKVEGYGTFRLGPDGWALDT